MSFYTALTGLNAATSQLGVTSNNIANVSTVGFKRSRTDFGDIFATSPLQKASSTIGQGVSLKGVSQEFSQGNMVTTSNTLDLAISGSGFFHMKSQDGFQDIYTRNGVFMLNDQYNVVNSAGQKLIAASVDSSGKANLDDMNVLTIPQRTTGMAKQTSQIALGLNLPSDAAVITKAFDRTDPTTYNKSTALTVYDSGGNSYLASIYYVKTQDASSSKPTNKWQTYVYIGDQLVSASLQQATNKAGELMYVNKYGELRSAADFTSAADQAALMSSFAKKTEKFSLDNLNDVRTSTPAAVSGSVVTSLGTGVTDGVDMSTYTPLSKADLLMEQGSESAMYVDLNSSTNADSYAVTFTPKNGSATTVKVATDGTTKPTVSSLVSALNADSAFASMYVAQSTSKVTIVGPHATSSSDIMGINITIDGHQQTIGNVQAASGNLSDIASALQSRLRSYDGGKSNLSVAVSDSGTNLVITDSLGRSISGVSLVLSKTANTNAVIGVTDYGKDSAGNPLNAATGQLQIAAIDPNTTSADIMQNVSLTKTVSASPETIKATAMVTKYPRVTANYDFTTLQSQDLYTVQMGSGATAQTITGLSLDNLVANLQNNPTFAADYKASTKNGVLSITSLVPANSLDQINGDLQITSTKGLTTTKPVVPTQQQAANFGVAQADLTAGPVTVSWGGTGGPSLTAAQGTSLSDFVTQLNSDLPTGLPSDVASAHFASNYRASLVNGQLRVTALDPSKAYTDITTDVSVTPSSPLATTNTVTYPVTADAGVPDDSPDVGKKSADELRDLFQLNVDGSSNPVTVSLARLAGKPITLSGAQLATELTNEINRSYGDEKPFNFYGTTYPTFSIEINNTVTSTVHDLPIDLTNAGDANHNMRYEDVVAAVQAQIDSDPNFSGKVTVSYDTAAQKLIFTPTNSTDKMSVLSSSNSIGITNPIAQASDANSVGLSLSPNVSTSAYRATADQRYGITVQYDAVKGAFVFNSGTTGDASSISISNIKPNSLATQTTKGLGLIASSYAVDKSPVDALRGLASKPAVLTGNAMSINANNNFAVDATNNTLVVSVNGVTGTVVIPPKDNYTIDTFTAALQNGINGLQTASTDGLSPQTIDGVKVTYDTTKNALVFTTGTASSDTYIKVTGDAKWGLTNLAAQFGSTTTWIKPTQSTDATGAAVYIDALGKETTSAAGFANLPAWSPVYLEKGELTFDTSGKLISPLQGAQLDTVYLPNGKGALTINVDYSKSTQYASAFSVLSQSQDGSPEGDLVSLAINNDGLVQASYSNGAEKSLAKIVLANFSNPSGLRQIGDTNYYATSQSGVVKYNEAGSAGYGTVRSGTTERANVDLTQELVDLITEQRNFQASAKAMETDTQMTQTIIQIRN